MKKSVFFLSALLFLCACGGKSTKTVPVISVSVSPFAQTNIDQGQTLKFTATVSNDSSSKGVTWTMSGTSCTGSACGTLTNNTTSGVTYNAPASVSANMQVTVQATSAADTSKSKSVAVVVSPKPSISTTTLADGVVGAPYNATLQASGGAGTLTWSLASGSALPAGLSLSSAGAIVGTPTAAGTTKFTAKVTDGSGCEEGPWSESQQLSITIAPGPLTITTTSLPNATINSAYSEPLVAVGGTPPYTWTVASGSSLPPWLSLGGAGTTWKIFGTPAATGTANFSLTVTDSKSQAKTQALSVTVVGVTSACGTGSESLLKGQYAFTLRGYNASGFLAAIGSFTADGAGHITAGTVDSNGSLGVKTGNVTATGSSYSIGSDNRGCATIVTPFYTFNTRFALETPTSTVVAAGAIEEWEPGPSPYIAAGQILIQKSLPATLPKGVWVYEQTGVFGTSQYRLASIGTITSSGSGTFTAGEYDSNVAGVHKNYSGLSGTYTTANPTTGRYTTSTSLSGVTVPHVAYLVSSTQYIQLTTEALSSTAAILIAEARLQSGSLTISGKLAYYGSAMDHSGAGSHVEFGLVTASGSGTLTANAYENNAGTWVTPAPTTISCNYAIDSYGRITTSGSGCANPGPVLYLIGPNTAFMLGTDAGVLVSHLLAQSAVTITPGLYFFGTQEPVNLNVETEVGVATLSSAGLTGTGDFTSMPSPQQFDQAVGETLTVNSDGTFSTSDTPGVVSGIVINGSQIIVVSGENTAYPTIRIISMVPLG